MSSELFKYKRKKLFLRDFSWYFNNRLIIMSYRFVAMGAILCAFSLKGINYIDFLCNYLATVI